MEQFLVKGIQLLLSLSLLIVLHELGHFIPAKIFKIRVEKFFLFFDVKFALFKKKIGDTVYGIGWLPLGGYVKIAGMIDESKDKEQMDKPAKKWEFRSKPAWQRLIIMLGGVTVNLVLGFLIYMMIIFGWGKVYVDPLELPNGYAIAESFKKYGFQDGDKVLKMDGKDVEDYNEVNRNLFFRDVENVTVLHPNGTREIIVLPETLGRKMFEKGMNEPFVPITYPIVDVVIENKAADKAGLKKGDSLISLNNIEVDYWHEIAPIADENKKEEIELNYSRNGNVQSVMITPDQYGQLGITPYLGFDTKKKTFSFLESIEEGFDYGLWTLKDYIAQFEYVFTKKGATQVGGFGAIGGLFPDEWNWKQFWSTTAFISIILAFMNILPIPALDGGHVMFLLYEIITGRKPNDRFMEVAQMVGFILLIALVLFANGNDIYRFFFG